RAAAQLDNQAARKALGRDLTVDLRNGALEAVEQPAAADPQLQRRPLRLQRAQPRLETAAGRANVRGEIAVLPEPQRLGGGDERRVVAAKRAGVLAGTPAVDCRPDQHDRHRQPEAADRFRQQYDVGLEAGVLEAEERTGAAAA